MTTATFLAAAKAAVRTAARLATAAQPGVSSVSKADASPVTVADLASQAAVALVLLRELHGAPALRALLEGGACPRAFRLVGEEDDAPFAAGDAASAALLGAVVDALAAGLPPRDAFLGGGASGGAAGAWRGADVRAALMAGACAGGLAAEGGEEDGGSARGYWVLDPIDGTKGFLRGGQWAVGLAFVSHGAPILSVIACPALPHPKWSGGGGGGSGSAAALAAAAASAGDTIGSLFYATRGGGSHMEPLWGEGLGGDGVLSAHISSTPPTPRSPSHLIMCESYDPGHSDHDASAFVRGALGLSGEGEGEGSPIRIDSMAKYGLLARGCGDIYLRCVAWWCVVGVLAHSYPPLSDAALPPHPQPPPAGVPGARVGPRARRPALARGGRRRHRRTRRGARLLAWSHARKQWRRHCVRRRGRARARARGGAGGAGDVTNKN